MKKFGFVDPHKPKCLACGLDKQCQHPKMPAAGDGEAGILIVTECPTNAENTSGKPFMGKMYDFLTPELRRIGIDLKKDTVRVCAMGCRKAFKKGKSDYTEEEIKYCAPYLMGMIEKHKPKIILVLGAAGLTALIKDIFSDCSIGRWRGLPFPYTTPKGHSCWVLATFNPSLSVDSDKKYADNYAPVIKKDIASLSWLLKTPMIPFKKPNVLHLIKFEDVMSTLKRVYNRASAISLDYETSGLKPEDPKHFIATVSITALYDEMSDDPYNDDNVETYSFPYSYKSIFTPEQQEEIGSLLADIIEHPEIFLIAHNAKFEQRWSKAILGAEFNKQKTFCTMIQAHLIDERKRFCGLKFLSYLYFGVPDYSKGVSHYLESNKASSNSFNNIESAPLPELLEYNGYDTYYTYLLYKVQMQYNRKNPHLSKGVQELFQQGAVALGNAEALGFELVPDYFKENADKIRQEKAELEKYLLTSREAILFKKKTGHTFSFSSDADLDVILYDIIGVTLEKATKSGARSKDAEVMISMKHEWTTKFLEYKKLEKVEETYFAQIMREEYDGILHTVYNLHTTRTGRSSSTNPNWQNLPKRDKKAMAYVRNGITCPVGQQLGEADYGSLEVRIAACYTKDPKLIYYINDPTTDMHRDSALDIFMIKKSEYDGLDKNDGKTIRFHAKNGFVFANFYGASYKSCAASLWKVAPDLSMGKDFTLMDHLNYQGFRRFDEYEEHIKEVVEKFWKKFSVFRKWQLATIDFYNKNLYVENLLGFRRRGPLGRNEVINTAIQGTAFQCLLWSFNRLDTIQNEQRWNSRIKGQIHDSIVFSLDPAELEVLPRIKHVMEVEMPKHFASWMCVPMVAEFELSPVNGTWMQLKTVEV